MDDLFEHLRHLPSPLVNHLGLQLDSATEEEVSGSLTVDPGMHLHPWGAVHGGVYCSMIETLATVGAMMSALPEGRSAVGIENHTSFVRSVREGTLRAYGRALSRGRQMHLWSVRIVDEEDRLIAQGTVRLALLEARTS